MSLLASPLLLHHPSRDVSVDATTMGIEPRDLERLPWGAALQAMARLEAGAQANPDEGRQVGHYWLRDPQRAPSRAQTRAIEQARRGVSAFAERIRSGALTTPEGRRFSDVIHVGIGGSSLGPRLWIEALADGAGLPVHFLDNVDPGGIARGLRRLSGRLAGALILVVSKSGSTPEVVHASQLVAQALLELGLEPAGRQVAVTTGGSALERRARLEGWLEVFPLWPWVGGRSCLTAAAGLLPAALAGVDVDALLQGARATDGWTRSGDWRSNPAALLAGCWYLAGRGTGERAMVVQPYADRLEWLSRYLQQLVMESVGKRHDLEGRVVHQGLTVYGNKGSTDQHALVQQLRDGRDDFFVQFVQVLSSANASPEKEACTAGDVLQGFLLGTRRALAAERRPSLVITVPRVDAFELGGLVALFERAVGLYGSLIGVNVYDQPGVEAGKLAAAEVLELSARILGILGPEGRTADAVAEALDAEAVVVFHVLQRLAATGRAGREGCGPRARFSAP